MHREQKINEIRKETKTKLNVLIDKINDVLKELEFKLDRIKLKWSWKGQINEIKRLKGVENNENTLSD